MMNKITFFKTIKKALEQTPFEDIINYDERLIIELKTKTNSEIAQFHLCMLELRRELDTFEINKVARSLDLAPNREIFNRFCNGIIASGEEFYDQAKEGKGFLETKLHNNPEEIKQLYYEGLSLVSSAAYYDKKGLDADWDVLLRNEKRRQELEQQVHNKSELER
ncbi:DUF4240 domain-containing protein [Olleya sp. UBA1516]|uniref:DUF4240 domain-containing protein n=1 Tax=Olleya sp. UBA1516 TaxID=1947013 RepID=UPI0025FE42FD|nr:DUF4240 domain-containing protein [Olleya sp. UBA1516]|tara:strand:- start:1582 stop:2076 length:495 start_codon:yes stop_codon:yes gene_type:complete